MKQKTYLKLEDYINLKSFSRATREKIVEAYELAERAHKDQKRLSGEPYIIHPLEVAKILYDMGFNDEVIVAALLHDTVEDTALSLREIKELFGQTITDLVDGVTKISKIKSENTKLSQVENIRKVLFSMVKDVRVILIKLADKLHNMSTLEYLDKEKRTRIARETLDIYAPLAGRLGMARIKAELEDLALKYLEPEFYNDLKMYIDQKKETRERYIEQVKSILYKEFKGYGIRAEIEGRAKHFYSIYTKMKEKDRSFDEIYDLSAVRIITNSIKECYEVLGIVHKIWMPVRGRFKDYIAMPKSNMYQSLHTTVIGPDGKTLEIQIRTKEMNLIAEEGIAAHWYYKERKRVNNLNISKLNRELSWINRLKNWQESLDNPISFMEELQKELLVDQIYVFTPKGDVIELPVGATPIDFAYKIHTEVGHHCIGAKVNGKIVPLRRPLRSCEVVQILTSKNSTPSFEWLDVVKTSHAKHKIRAFFNQSILKKEEQKSTDKQKPDSSKDTAKTPGTKSRTKIKRRKVDISVKDEKISLEAEGESNIQIHIAKCCNPHPGDEIVGYITRGRGISVHQVNCKNLASIKDLDKRRIAVEWSSRSKRVYSFKILCHDRSGLLMDISTAIANANANVLDMSLHVDEKGMVNSSFKVQMADEKQLNLMLESVKSIKDIISINYA